MEIKYTSDGKKVAVLGNLNKNEKIVQEIFIINEQEVPSGENFVVTSLHDAPAISWKEKKIKEISDQYENDKSYWDLKLETLRKKSRAAEEEYRVFIEHYTKDIDDNHLQETINRIVKIMTGRMTHLVINTYGSKYKLTTFKEAIRNKEESIKYGLKLMTIYGRSQGKLDLRLNRYSDGSGGSEYVYAFESEEESKNFIIEETMKKVLENKKVDSDQIKCAEEFGFELPNEYIESYYKLMQKQYKEYIKRSQDDIDKYQAVVDGFKNRKDLRSRK